jgi:hypothetical protein
MPNEYIHTKRTIEIEQVSKNCEVCGKKIKGSTESQVAFNLGIHKLTHKYGKNGKKRIERNQLKEERRNVK